MQNAEVTGEQSWLPENWAEAVRTCRDLQYPPIPYGEAWDLAREITEPVYNHRLATVLPSKLPPGLPMGGPYECPLPSNPEFLLWSRSKLVAYARQAADDRVDIEANATLDSWASGWSTAVIKVDSGTLETCEAAAAMLRSALLELSDDGAAIRSVKFWTGIGTCQLPPSWTDVNTLLQDRPEWLTVGFAAMLDRGEVTPPWLTAAIT
jgi:hypothetical protein